MSIIEYSVLDYLPKTLLKELSKFSDNSINEIRIRRDCPVVVTVEGERIILSKISLSETDIENVIYKVCDGTIYSYEDQIVNGYITDNQGVRIGLSGEFVVKNSKILAIRRFYSLCIRIPHAIREISTEFYNCVYRGGSILVVSPPGVGKTSFIRDLINNLSVNSINNVVVVDERNEISMNNPNGSSFINNSVDVLVYATKDYGFNQAIRTLNPNYIITDELVSLSDVNSVINAIYGGVSVVATVHGDSLENCFSKEFIKPLKRLKVFDYVVLIELKDNQRKYSYFDKDFNKICLL